MATSGVIDFNQPRNFSLKMNAMYVFLRQNFKSFTKSLLFIAGPPVLISGILFIEIFQRLIDAGKYTDVDIPGPFNMGDQFDTVNFALQILAIILFALIGGVFTIATTYAYMKLYQEKNGEKITVNEVWKLVRKSFWMNLGTMLLYTIFMTIACIILIFPVALLAVAFVVVSPILVAVAYLAYYLLVFFLMINFMLIFVIRNFEGIGFFTAVDKMIYLNKRKWWSTFGIGGINMYVQYIFCMLLFLPGYIIMIITLMHNKYDSLYDKPSDFMQVISSISFVLYFLGSIILSALPLVALAFQYFNLVELRQAKGLMTKIQNLGTVAVQHEDHGDY